MALNNLTIQRRAQLTIQDLQKFLDSLPGDAWRHPYPVYLNDSAAVACHIYLDEDSDGPFIAINGI